MRALIIFASSEGQTTKIAETLREELRNNKLPTDTYSLADHDADRIDIDQYDAVLIGSPLHYAEYDAKIQEFISENSAILQKLPSAFFSVSLGIRSDHVRDRREVVELTNQFFRECGFEPDMTTYFAGALKYSKYNWLKKRVMRWIANQSGEKDKDFSNDHEYTDWEAVSQFASEFAQAMRVVEKADSPDPKQTIAHYTSTKVEVYASG